jgi:hypothetical protein
VKLLGAKIGAKTLADMVNYITDFESGLQSHMEKAFVKYLKVDKTTAHWVAKTIIFVFF